MNWKRWLHLYLTTLFQRAGQVQVMVTFLSNLLLHGLRTLTKELLSLRTGMITEHRIATGHQVSSSHKLSWPALCKTALAPERLLLIHLVSSLSSEMTWSLPTFKKNQPTVFTATVCIWKVVNGTMKPISWLRAILRNCLSSCRWFICFQFRIV